MLLLLPRLLQLPRPPCCCRAYGTFNASSSTRAQQVFQQVTAGSPPAVEQKCSAAGGELRKLIPLPNRAQRAF